jgi:hypothetical protein
MKLKCNDCVSVFQRYKDFAEPCPKCKSVKIEVIGFYRYYIKIKMNLYKIIIAGRYVKSIKHHIQIRYNRARGNTELKFNNYGQSFEVSKDGIPCDRCDKTMFKGWSQVNGKLYCSNCVIKLMGASNIKGTAHPGKAAYKHPSRKDIMRKMSMNDLEH